MPTQSLLVENNYTSIMTRINWLAAATANSSSPRGIVPNMSAAIAPLLAGSTTHAVVATSIVNANFARAHCELNTTRNELPAFYVALVYSTSASPELVQALSLAAVALKPTAERLYSQYFVSNCTYSQLSRPLSISDFVGLFFMFCSSIIFAVIGIAVTIVWHEIKMLYKRRQLRAGIHYRFGKGYCARVVKV